MDFSAAFIAKKLPLHVLVADAGVFLQPHSHTEEGFEVRVMSTRPLCHLSAKCSVIIGCRTLQLHYTALQLQPGTPGVNI